MDYNVFKKDVHLLQSLYDKIQMASDNISDTKLLQQKIDELEKYLNDTDNTIVYKELLEIEFHKTLVGLMRILIERNDLNLVTVVSKFISSITECSEEFSDALVKEDIPDLLISLTIKCGDKDFVTTYQNSVNIENIIYYVLHITYHIIRHIRFHQYFLLHEHIRHFKQTILPWMSSKIVNTRILATFIVTWLMKEDSGDRDTIEKHADVIKHVVDYIKEIIKSQVKSYRGYSLWELLFGLQALTSIDSIKAGVINIDGFITSLIYITKAEFSESREIETALEILWSLTFVEKNRDILKTKYQIEDVVQNMSKSQNLQVRKKVKGILWELTKKRKVKADLKPAKYDVFISYSHAQKESIAKLSEVLKTKFKVWKDVDNMKGSGLNDMATGIEQSTIFLMAVSSSYKKSQCCRSEANWAFKLNKPIIPLMMVHKYSPDGWLGMMISSETYIDFSNQSDFKEASDKIKKHISYKCNQIKNETEQTTSDKDQKVEKHDEKMNRQCSGGKSTDLPDNIRDWDACHVTHWLDDHKLSHLSQKFNDFDGGMLLAMRNMMEKTYEKYNDNMEKKFQMSLTDILKFDSALASLKI